MSSESFVPIIWTAPERVHAVSTTRHGGVSEDSYQSFNLAAHVGDADGAVAENRSRLLRRAALPREPLWLDQVHGADVVVAGSQPLANAPRADAAVTRERGVPLAILTADCLPILMCDMDDTVVAAVHAGWRGLAAGVIEAAVEKMGVPPDRILAWFGPAIGRDDFEVRDDVWDAFVACDWQFARCFSASGRQSWYADLYSLARRMLAAIGVTRVFGGDVSTFADPDRFFSYRRDGQCGRMASVIWR